MHHHVRPLVVAIIAAVSLGALAGCRHRHRPDPEKLRKYVTYFVDDLLDDLEATPEQRQAVQASKARLLEAGLAMRAEGPATHRQLLGEWQKETPDVEAIRALVDARLARARQVAMSAVDELAAVHAVLTPAQRAMLAARAEEHFADE